MNWAPAGSPYVVRRREGSQVLFEVRDLRMVDVVTGLFHMVRKFSVEISCPEPVDERRGRPPYLWVPVGESEKLDREVSLDRRISFERVTTDLVCGSEEVFYRDKSLVMISIENAAEEFYKQRFGIN
jgi:hypothetical protein